MRIASTAAKRLLRLSIIASDSAKRIASTAAKRLSRLLTVASDSAKRSESSSTAVMLQDDWRCTPSSVTDRLHKPRG